MVGMKDKIRDTIKSLTKRGEDAIDASEVHNSLNDFKKYAAEAKQHVEPDYELIEAYYSGNIDRIFRDWRNSRWYRPWMKFTHTNKVKEATDNILANVIPAWPRPMLVATRTEHRELAEAGDALLNSTLQRGGYQVALIRLVTLMVKFNTAFISPSLDRLTYFPEKRITFDVHHPWNVLMTPGAESTDKAAQVLITRRVHKEILKGQFPDKKDEIDRLAGRRVKPQAGHYRGPNENLHDTLYTFDKKNQDDPNNVTLELFYQRDWQRKTISASKIIEKITKEDLSYVRSALEGALMPPEDTFDILDKHVAHNKSHRERLESLKSDGIDPRMPAMLGLAQHIAQHQAAIAQDIAGGEELAFPDGKRFSLIAGEKEVFYDGPDPYSAFGIKDFPIIDFQLTQDGDDYWQVALGKALVDLNADRNRLTNGQVLSAMAYGFPKFVTVEGGLDSDINNVKNDPFEHIVEKREAAGATRYLNPPSSSHDLNISIQRIDTDLERITGLFSTFRGELPDRISGKAIEQLNIEAAKTIDVKIDSQRDSMRRLGDMVYKMALSITSPEDKAIVVGERGVPFVQDFDLEALKQVEYSVISIPGKKAVTPLDMKQQAYQQFIARIAPVLAQLPQGLALIMKMELELGKGFVPELEKFETDILGIIQSLNPEEQQMLANAAGMTMPTNAGGGQV